MLRYSLLCISLGFLCSMPLASYAADGVEPVFQAPPPDAILKTLKAEHPRLLVDEGILARIKELSTADPIVWQCLENVRTEAKALLDAPPSKYEIPDGKRLLSVSRRVVGRVGALGLVYLLDGGDQYKDRAWAELEAAANFKDWNPSHFLDTAEMTFAFAIGYDWFNGAWTEAQRATLREAIVKLGLNEAMKVYQGKTWWAVNENNWNQVCNGGIGMGALSIADEIPDLATAILSNAIESLPLAMSHYAPDGAGTEGVTYWDYGSRYNILLLAGLESALGTDFGLADIPGFAESGNYQRYLSGADALSFDFADCGLQHVGTAQHFWMARRFGRPEFSAFRLDRLRADKRDGGVLDLLWYDASGASFDPSSLPLDKYYRGAETASMRSAWGDPNALVLAIQAGDSMNLGGHRHLDLGSFILEANGVRWIIDSGKESETYQAHRHHNPRHAYYRIRAEGHNVPVLNPDEGPDQDPKAVAKIVEFNSTPDHAKAVVDLSEAYREHASQVMRTFLMLERSVVQVTDEVRASRSADFWWFLQTPAQVSLSDNARIAQLTKDGKALRIRIIEPAQAAFTVGPAEPLATSPNPSPQESNKGRSRLAIHLDNARDVVVTVRFEPQD